MASRVRFNDPTAALFAATIGNAIAKTQAARAAIKIPAAPPMSLLEFLHAAWPHFVKGDNATLRSNWHIETICEHVERVMLDNTGNQKLIINVPPGSTKSSIITIALLPWVWTFKPSFAFLSVCRDDSLANTFSRHARGLIESEWYQQKFPWVKLSVNQVGQFLNTHGGERRACGLFTGVTGRHYDAIVIDDGTAANKTGAAELDTAAENLQAFYSRFKDPARRKIVIVGQRLHFRDIVGAALSTVDESKPETRWNRLVLPMRYDPLIAEMTNTGFIDPRQPGEILDPTRWNEADLNELRSQLGSVAYAQQYQQVVAPAEGAAFKRDNLKLVTRIPELTHQIRAWDLAKSTSRNADFTAGVKVGLGVDGNYYILDAVHFRLEPSEATAKIVEVARLDGLGVGIRFEEESGAAGGYVSNLFRQQLVGWQIAPMKANASKEIRAGLAMEYSRNGQLKMLDAPWSELLTAELTIFPNGRHDDLVDAMCYAINAIAESVRLGRRLSVDAAPVVRI